MLPGPREGKKRREIGPKKVMRCPKAENGLNLFGVVKMLRISGNAAFAVQKLCVKMVQKLDDIIAKISFLLLSV